MRASRYPTDFNSHLEHLGQPFDETIERRDPNRFIDENLFTFSLPHQTRRVRVSDKTLDLLKSPDRCQILQIPDNAELTLGFGAWIEDQAEDLRKPLRAALTTFRSSQQADCR